MAEIVDLSALIRNDRMIDGIGGAHEDVSPAGTSDDVALRLEDFVHGASTGSDARNAADLDAEAALLIAGMLDASERADAGTMRLPEPDPGLDWTNQELADLYRVQRLLAQAGVAIACDRGVTDEGDPWFVFLDSQGEVFVHLCRVDGLYILDSAVQDGVVFGHCFRALIDGFAGRTDNALAAGRPDGSTVVTLQRRGKIVMHPGAALAALIWTLYLANDELALLDSEPRPEPVAPAASDDAAEGGIVTAEAGDEALAPIVEDEVTPEFGALFTDAKDAAEFLAEAKAARDAALRTSVSDGRDGQSHGPLAALANPLGAAAFGLSALAAAYGIAWKPIGEETATLSATDQGHLHGGDDATARHDAEDGHTDRDGINPVATAAPVLADDGTIETMDDPGLVEANAAKETVNAGSSSALATMDLTQPIEDTVPVVAQAAVAAPKIATDAAPQTRAADTETASDGADTPATAQNGGASGISAGDADLGSAVHTLLAKVGMEAPIESEVNIFSFEDHSLGSSQSLFQFIDDSLLFVVNTNSDDAGDTVIETVVEVEAPVVPETEFAIFDDEAREFVNYLVANGDVEVVAYRNEVLLIDRRTLEDDGAEAFARSWSYEDGGVISTVGIRADFEAFDLLA